MNTTRAILANLTGVAMVAYAVLMILTLFVQILTVGGALFTELGERFVYAGQAACAAACESGTAESQSTSGFYGTTTRAYNAATGGA